MKKTSLYLIAMGLFTLLAGCRKDVIKNLDDNESIVYITEHDSTKSFSNYHTFKIADSVSVIGDGQFAGRAYTLYDSNLIASLRQAMVQRGFQLETDRTKTPDIGINVSRITTQYTGIVSYNDYYGIYDSYWDPYDWGYGGYDYYFPYAFGTYTFREGALSLDMVDLKNPDTNTNRLRTLWTGLARGTGIFGVTNVNDAVQALFNQSPYISQ
ncbi:MAG: DUF4136 domain-containing protein [Ferruginibacter sp.]